MSYENQVCTKIIKDEHEDIEMMLADAIIMLTLARKRDHTRTFYGPIAYRPPSRPPVRAWPYARRHFKCRGK